MYVVKNRVAVVTGHFIKQEQWERWRAKRKLMSAFRRAIGVGAGGGTPFPLRCPGVSPPETFELVCGLYGKSCNVMHFGRKKIISCVTRS